MSRSPSDVVEPAEDLPFVDEHEVLVAAPASAVWRVLTAYVDGLRTARAAKLADLMGAKPRRTSGAFLTEGATIPGFRVMEAVPERRLRLAGRHRFSRHSLTFTLTPSPGGTMLRARTHAEFPGFRGRAYCGLVIRSGAHKVVVSHQLHAVRRGAERQAVR